MRFALARRVQPAHVRRKRDHLLPAILRAQPLLDAREHRRRGDRQILEHLRGRRRRLTCALRGGQPALEPARACSRPDAASRCPDRCGSWPRARCRRRALEMSPRIAATRTSASCSTASSLQRDAAVDQRDQTPQHRHHQPAPVRRVALRREHAQHGPLEVLGVVQALDVVVRAARPAACRGSPARCPRRGCASAAGTHACARCCGDRGCRPPRSGARARTADRRQRR